MRPIVRFALLAVVFSLCWVTSAAAARLRLIGNFDQPIFVTSDPANPDSLYIVERDGRVVRFENGTASVFADLTGLVACCEGERGLLSIALAPDFETSARFFAAYTGKPNAGGAEGDVHVDAFAAGGGRKEGLGRINQFLRLEIGCLRLDAHFRGEIEYRAAGDSFEQIDAGRE